MLATRSGPPLGKGTGVTPSGPHKLLRGRPGWRGGAPPGHVGCIPGIRRGGGHGFVPYPGVSTHTQPGALGSALNLASPQRPMAAATVLSSQKGGELRDWYVE